MFTMDVFLMAQTLTILRTHGARQKVVGRKASLYVRDRYDIPEAGKQPACIRTVFT